MFDYYLRATLLETLALVFIATFAFVLWLNYCDPADPPNQGKITAALSFQFQMFNVLLYQHCHSSLRLFAILRENCDTKLQIFSHFSPAPLKNPSIFLRPGLGGRNPLTSGSGGIASGMSLEVS